MREKVGPDNLARLALTNIFNVAIHEVITVTQI